MNGIFNSLQVIVMTRMRTYPDSCRRSTATRIHSKTFCICIKNSPC